jgi:hypothetical protein
MLDIVPCLNVFEVLTCDNQLHHPAVFDNEKTSIWIYEEKLVCGVGGRGFA